MQVKTFYEIEQLLAAIVASPASVMLSPSDRKSITDIHRRVNNRIQKSQQLFDDHMKQIEELATKVRQ